MTPKDLRDIAAYYGTRFGGQVAQMTADMWAGYANPLVSGSLIAALEEFGSDSFKLKLRPIQSLTNEELTECARIDAGGDFRHGGVYQINRYADSINVYYGNGANIEFAIPNVFYADEPAGQVAETIAYLQSIGVYVPGTIDKKYVELIQ